MHGSSKVIVMKLSLITELKVRKAFSAMGPLLSVMPKSKRKHSRRVAKSLKKAGAGQIGVYAGLLHDYIENGGDILSLSLHIEDLGLPDRVVDVVHALSNDEKDAELHPNQPLAHLRLILSNVDDEQLKNIIILAKLSDRLDNLTKRANRGKIGRKYRLKSFELIEWLRSNYTGKNKPFNRLIKAIRQIMPRAVFEPL